MQTPVRQNIRSAFLEFLPDDGTPILNRIMRLMISRSLEQVVSADEYFAVRNALFNEGKIGRARGPGGQVFLVQDAPHADTDHTYGAVVCLQQSEAELMPLLADYLSSTFTEYLDLPHGSKFLIEDVSLRGPRSGRWARPDFILISVMRFKFLPGNQVDVHSFELKNESGGNVLAVHEALAQTRFTHFGHLVWHLPHGSRFEAKLEEVRMQCDAHGIGLILMREPAKPKSYEILVDPKRKQTPAPVVDGFLETRLSKANQSKLIRAADVDRSG